MAEGKPFEGECRILKSDGEVRWFWVKAVAETNQSGQVVAWLGTCTDIHDRKITEMKLIEAEKEAKAAGIEAPFLVQVREEPEAFMSGLL